MVDTVRVSPIYDRYFPIAGPNHYEDWKDFETSDVEMNLPLSKRPIDFSIEERSSLAKTVEYVALVVLKIVIFPWGIYTLAKYVVQRLIMIPLFPSQSGIMKWVMKDYLSNQALDAQMLRTAHALRQKGYIVRHVSLAKNGKRYSGLLIGTKETIANGRWAQQASGNAFPIEHAANVFAPIYKKYGFNLLMINGPNVGKSEGEADSETMGDAQEIGISFLETAIKAKNIAIAGYSLGGGAVGKAILKHSSRPDIRYIVIRQMSFDRSSNVCRKVIETKCPSLGRFTKKMVKWSGCELDSVAASKKLQQLGIREVIIQAGIRDVFAGLPTKEDFQTDGVIPAKGSLGYKLIKKGIANNKVFICLKNVDHTSESALAAFQMPLLNFTYGF